MKCNDFHEHILDLATGTDGPAEARAHVAACAGCAAELESFRKTMALMEEWAAPADTTPYFMTRLRARLREEQDAPARGWLTWFRRPALAVTMMLLMVLSIGLFRGGFSLHSNTQPKMVAVKASPGTPVGDLQRLDKDHDLLADFDMLDSLEESTAAGAQQ